MRARYFFNGTWYSDKNSFVRATGGVLLNSFQWTALGPPGPRFEQALRDRPRLEASVNAVTQEYLRLGGSVRCGLLACLPFLRASAGEERTELTYDEGVYAVISAAAQAGVPDLCKYLDEPRLKQMLYRFDQNGSGHVSAVELLKLLVYALQWQRDQLKEPPLLELPHKNPKEIYELGKLLGQGGQGAVYLARLRGKKLLSEAERD